MPGDGGHSAVFAAQDYRTSSPVTARPMIMRWISLVPSKMVKLSDVSVDEQRLYSRSSASPVGWPMVVDGRLSLVSRFCRNRDGTGGR
jgi:hypothetical protein